MIGGKWFTRAEDRSLPDENGDVLSVREGHTAESNKMNRSKQLNYVHLKEEVLSIEPNQR
jgi:hypothetical protein